LFLGRRDTGSQEAKVKYFFLSVLSSTLLLYGFSFLYGIAGSTRLDVIHQSLTEAGGRTVAVDLLGPISLLLILAGLGFKIAAVPFHFYAPDVYQGTTNLNAGLLAVLPKIAGIVALVRLVACLLPAVAAYGWQICLVMAVLTMTLGNVVALWQRNIRRLLAYSSIAHAGYMLIGLSVWIGAARFADRSAELGTISQSGLAAALLYLVVYVIASLGTFAALVYLGHDGRQIDEVDQLTGLGQTHRGAAIAIALFMFSLAGIPPLAGFWGKLGLFTSALAVDVSTSTLAGISLRVWFVALAVVGVLNAAIAAAYYLRVVAVMYFQTPRTVPGAEGGAGAAWAMAFCAVAVVALGVVPGPLAQSTNVAAAAPAISAGQPVAVAEPSPSDEVVDSSTSAAQLQTP
jgi:NADH-quinone oxidoreductase subunit N